MTRTRLAVVLGLFWIFDGLLQLQPAMFDSSFARSVIGMAADGQLGVVAGPMHLAERFGATYPVLFTLVIAVVQVGLGIMLLLPRWRRIGLWASVVWGLGVWAVGEGYSGILSGHAFTLSGSPGAAAIYVLLALGILLGERHDLRPNYVVVWGWAVIWCVGAAYQLLPGQNSLADIAGMISASGNGAPGWLAGIDSGVAHWVMSLGSTAAPTVMTGMPGMNMGGMGSGGYIPGPSGLAWALAAWQFVIGIMVFGGRVLRRASVVMGCGLAVIFWVVGQGLGMWWSGQMTDPNSGPLIVILGCAVWGCSQLDGAIRARIRLELAALNAG